MYLITHACGTFKPPRYIQYIIIVHPLTLIREHLRHRNRPPAFRSCHLLPPFCMYSNENANGCRPRLKPRIFPTELSIAPVEYILLEIVFN